MANVSVVQATGGSAFSSNPAVSYISNCTNGSYMLCVLGMTPSSGGGANITGVSDPHNGAWTKIDGPEVQGTTWQSYLYGVRNTGTTALTVTAAASASASVNICIIEFTGVPASGPVVDNFVQAPGPTASHIYTVPSIVPVKTKVTAFLLAEQQQGFTFTGPGGATSAISYNGSNGSNFNIGFYQDINSPVSTNLGNVSFGTNNTAISGWVITLLSSSSQNAAGVLPDQLTDDSDEQCLWVPRSGGGYR